MDEELYRRFCIQANQEIFFGDYVALAKTVTAYLATQNKLLRKSKSNVES